MNSRKLFALFLVLALTGSALAAQQQRLYKDTSLEATDVTAVQQHSVFIEIVVEDQDRKDQIHKFAAVVGLIKKCKQVRNDFDNAVLWFNDQFLFGAKDTRKQQNVTDKGLGHQPNVSATDPDPTDDNDPSDDGFLKENNHSKAPNPQDPDPRWGGCYTPDGFAHAIGADDPFGTFGTPAGNASADDAMTGIFGTPSANDNVDVIKELIDLDNDCLGCIFEYEGSFFVVDPNDHEWIVDKYVYPLSVLNNLFSSGTGEDCGDDEASETEPTPESQGSPGIFTSDGDPRSTSHADRCEDDNAENNAYEDKENHCYDDGQDKDENDEPCDGSGADDSATPIVEPLFSTHLQTDPRTPTAMGFPDEATYRFEDTGTNNTNQTRDGAIYPREGTDNREFCENNQQDLRCALEYNFLLAVDFAAFDNGGLVSNEAVDQTGEDEISNCGEGPTGGQTHGDGQGSADQAGEDEEYWQGNSHPHNPNQTHPYPHQNRTNGTHTQGDAQPHCHSEVNLDVFFYGSAPNFTMAHQYWSEEHGTPISWTDDCEQAEDPADRGTQSEGGLRDTADSNGLGEEDGPIDARTPIVCDADSDDGEYHQHDGTQSPSSYNYE